MGGECSTMEIGVNVGRKPCMYRLARSGRMNDARRNVGSVSRAGGLVAPTPQLRTMIRFCEVPSVFV